MIIEFVIPDKTPFVRLVKLYNILSVLDRESSLHSEVLEYMEDITDHPTKVQSEYTHSHTKDGFVVTFTYKESGKISLISKKK